MAEHFEDFRAEYVKGGRNLDTLTSGWSRPEPGLTWTLGKFAVISIPVVQARCDTVLSLSVQAVAPRPQRVIINFNSLTICYLMIERGCKLEFFLPQEAFSSAQKQIISFSLPDAVSPSIASTSTDTRILGIALSSLSLTPMTGHLSISEISNTSSDYEIMLSLESVGINCEFGFCQRAFGAEPLGLFRWSFTPLMTLLKLLECKFEGFADYGSLTLSLSNLGEYLLNDKNYNFLIHTFEFASETQIEHDVLNRHSARLRYLARHFVDTLNEGSKLFVYHDAGSSSISEVNRLAQSLRNYNQLNRLLWVCLATSDNVAGTVTVLSDGIICGFLDKFEPVRGVKWASTNCWMNVARAAFNIWKAGYLE